MFTHDTGRNNNESKIGILYFYLLTFVSRWLLVSAGGLVETVPEATRGSAALSGRQSAHAAVPHGSVADTQLGGAHPPPPSHSPPSPTQVLATRQGLIAHQAPRAPLFHLVTFLDCSNFYGLIVDFFILVL